MANAPAWSHTSLTAFESCPRKYFETRVSKSVKEDFGEAALWGQRVHKALEDRAKLGTPLPDYLGHCDPIIENIKSKDGQLLVEEKICLDQNFQPIGWFDKGAWTRAVIDIGVVNERNAVLIDWKTGKRKPDNDQLRLFAAISFKRWPWVEKIATAFAWLKDNKIDRQVFTRKQDEAMLWQEVLPRVQRLENAYEKSSWPAKPSGLCKGWCPVKSCEHWRQK